MNFNGSADYNMTQFIFSQCRHRLFCRSLRLCVKKIQLDMARIIETDFRDFTPLLVPFSSWVPSLGSFRPTP